MGAALEAITHEGDDRSFDTSHWHRHTYLSKYIFNTSVLCKIKSSSTWVIPASLCAGPFFYFYVESSPSTFMHLLREHSCHSEYNVHSPKIYYWLIHDYGIACLKLFVSSIELWRCPSIYVLLFHEGQAEYQYVMLYLCSKQSYDFQCTIIHDLLFVLLFMLQHSC